MAKFMIFIDGTWLYTNMSRLAQSYGQNYQIDYGKLPIALTAQVTNKSGHSNADLVRTYLFGSYAENFHPNDHDIAERRIDFFKMLKEEFHYEVETYPVNYRGRHIRRADRDTSDPFEPKEKCVDISLATSMLYFAAIPGVYDIAIAVLGDQDYIPALQHLRRLGKRVAVVSVKGTCAKAFSDSIDEARVKDLEIIWLDDLLSELELKYERQLRECQAQEHAGDRKVWTEFRPRKGQNFYCDACRSIFGRKKEETPHPLGRLVLASGLSREVPC